MWSYVFIALLCILIPSAYTQGIKTSEYGPLEAPNCGYSNVTLRRIVGGQPATVGAWPWMTALGFWSGNANRPHWGCGGALVSSRHVLTAAHCCQSGMGLYVVRIADLDLAKDIYGAHSFQVDIQNIINHPSYKAKTHENDISILKVAKEVTFTSMRRPICLPVNFVDRKLDGLYGIIAGWGTTSSGGYTSSRLLQTQVPITTEQKCKQAYRNEVIDSRHLCAGYDQGGKDSCQGDSGGPLMLPQPNDQKTYYIYGVVSWGYGCAARGYPGVYTRVTSFLPFIIKEMAR